MFTEKTTEKNRLAREGHTAILFAIFLTVAGFVLHAALGVLATLWLVFCLNFFRNPKRSPAQKQNGILCTADGKVISVEESEEKEFLNKKMQKISIFMSPLDVHVNRAPVDGTVRDVSYQSGKFLAAFDKNASDHNERVATHIVDDKGEDLVFVQIAGWLARRIINYVKPGDTLRQGDIFGLIKFGSRMDIYFPSSYRVQVSLDQRVKAGQTWLATKK